MIRGTMSTATGRRDFDLWEHLQIDVLVLLYHIHVLLDLSEISQDWNRR